MTTMTIPTLVERKQPKQAGPVSHHLPFLLAMVFLAAVGLASILISGPLH
jgi:hypothetical protein